MRFTFLRNTRLCDLRRIVAFSSFVPIGINGYSYGSRGLIVKTNTRAWTIRNGLRVLVNKGQRLASLSCSVENCKNIITSSNALRTNILGFPYHGGAFSSYGEKFQLYLHDGT